MQAELMYPHIANTDAKADINASWLRTLTNRSFHFDQWENEKDFKAAVGSKGEKAIFMGTSSLHLQVCLLANSSPSIGCRHHCAPVYCVLPCS